MLHVTRKNQSVIILTYKIVCISETVVDGVFDLYLQGVFI